MVTLADIERVLNKSSFSGLVLSIKKTLGLQVSPSQVIVFLFLALVIVFFIIAFFITIFSRGRVRIKDNPATSGRFATNREVLSRLAIPDRVRVYAILGLCGSVLFYALGIIPYYLIYHKIAASPVLAVISLAAALGLLEVFIKGSMFFEKRPVKIIFSKSGLTEAEG